MAGDIAMKTPNDATSKNARKAKGREALAKWRAKQRRIDYAPSKAAQAVIDHHLGAKLDTCLVGVLDRLVLAGHRAISGDQRKLLAM